LIDIERDLIEQTVPELDGSDRLEWQNVRNILTFKTVCKQMIVSVTRHRDD